MHDLGQLAVEVDFLSGILGDGLDDEVGVSVASSKLVVKVTLAKASSARFFSRSISSTEMSGEAASPRQYARASVFMV